MEEANELDLKELFKIIWEKKFFIVIFTFIVTVLSIIYALNIKPIYEVKSIIKIGNINGVQLEETNLLAKKLNLIFQVGRVQNKIEEKKAILSNASIVKKFDDLIEVSTQAFSNDLAIKKNQEILDFIKEDYKYKIDEYIFNTNLQIDKLKKALNRIKTIEKEDIENKIKNIKKIQIANLEKEIAFIKNVDLKILDNKLKFASKKILEYEENIKKITSNKSRNETQNLISSTQILSNQNLILNLKNEIEDLEKEKKNLKNFKLNEIEQKKENLIEIKLKKLIIQRDILQKEKIVDLENTIKKTQNKLTKNYVRNSHLLGSMIVNDSPIKPKKKLIVIVSFITAFILSILLVFFMQFLRDFKKKVKE